MQVNYQPIGSGGGIRQVTAGTVDFGASDMPMTDKQLQEAKIKILNIPTVLGAVVPAYNIPGVSGEVKFTPEVLAGIFLGKISKWNDKAIASGQPGSEFSRQGHHCRASLRRQRHDFHLDGLSLEGQLRIGRVRWAAALR